MPFCPQCGYEYQEGVRECPDCQQELVAEPPKEAHPTTAGWPGVQPPPPSPPPFLSNEPLVVVYETQDPAQAVEIRQALVNAGIPSFEQPDRTAAYDNLDFSMTGRYSRVLTLKSRAEEAQKVVVEFLRAFEDGKLELTEEEIENIAPPIKPEEVLPHRGVTILILGILAIAIQGCGIILGIIAVIMAHDDLKEMDAGKRDPAGREMTNIGRICGTIGICLPIAALVVWIIIVIIAAIVASL